MVSRAVILESFSSSAVSKAVILESLSDILSIRILKLLTSKATSAALAVGDWALVGVTVRPVVSESALRRAFKSFVVGHGTSGMITKFSNVCQYTSRNCNFSKSQVSCKFFSYIIYYFGVSDPTKMDKD